MAKKYELDIVNSNELPDATQAEVNGGKILIHTNNRLRKAPSSTMKGEKGDKLTFDDLTSYDIEILQRPAKEAAEEVRALAEEFKENEEGRIEAEAIREENEAGRQASMETIGQTVGTLIANGTQSAIRAENAATLANQKAQEAGTQADYAREQGDYAAEEGEKAAQAIPRIDALEQNKVDGGFSENGELFLTSGGVVVGDPIPVGSGSGGGGGGGGSTLRLINRGDASLGVPVGQKVILRYSFSSLDSETQEPTGNGTAVYYVNNARVYTQSISQGDIDFDISNYLSDGQNQIRIQATDSYGAIRSLNIRVEVINLVLESSFDDSLTYSNDISFPYTPKGSGEKTIHFILDGVNLSPVTTTTTNRQLHYKLSGLTHGSHSLTVYATMESDGVEISSNVLNFSIMYVQTGSTAVIISSSFNQATAVQYDNIVIPFSVYNPAASTTQIQLKANNEVVSTLIVDRLQQVWSYRIPGYGALKLEIVAGSVKKEFNLVVTKSSIDSEAETEGLELFLTSNGRSNNEEHPGVWKYNTIEAAFTGFNFKTNGWVLDDDNVTVLRISQGAKLEIPFYSFFSDFKQTGKTIEMEFRVKNVENFTSDIISCFSGTRGFRLTANDILFKSELSSVTAKFKEEEMIRVSFVVESRLKNRIIYTYINGIASGSIQYVDNDSFEQIPPVGITLGNPDCTLDMYTIRCYSTDLNAYQVLNNYIADTALVSKKLELYDNNQIYDSTGEIVYNLLVNQLPCMTITGELPTFKGDKKTVSMAFENRQNPERSFTADNVQIDVQGTSSQFYPRKNFKHKFKSGLTLTETGEYVEKYALKENAIPVDTFCEKADFAESSGTHNTGMARYIDSVLRSLNYLTPPQKTDQRVRTTVDGYPMAIFHKANDNSPAEFVGKYNFNNDKATQETFGFDGADECWEFLNNTANRCLFKSADFSGNGWMDDFEGRYPDGYTDATNLSALVGWVVSCIGNPTKFKSEVSAHFNLNNLLSYYLLSELFGMVDQRAKNMMLASWGNEGSGTYKWYFIFYDNDTCLGINNEGANVFPFDIEDHDTLGDGHVWNGWDSELWKLVKASFGGELAVMYRNMRQTGALSYNGAIRILNDEQAFKWSEVVYNLDGQYKYIQPLIETGQGTYLYALQGARTDHRIWWLRNRFFYMDSKYNAADFLNDFITMRIYTPSTWQGIAPNADFDLTLYKDSYVRVKYGSYVLEQRAKAEQTIHIAAPPIQFNDTETIIYGISTVKGIGALPALYPGTVDIANATTLTELIIGSAVSGYKNENLSHVSAGNNKMLRTVDIQNCPNYTEPLDLSGCENLEVLKALGSSVSAVKLPAAGIVSRMELPATIANLTIKNQQSLTSENLILTGTGNISTLVLENMNSLDVIGLVKTLLAVDPLNLNRLRLIGVDMEDDDLSVLMKLATIGGLDEQDNPLPRAVITGKFRAGSAYETDISNCRGWFPELEITVDTELTDPVTTFEFSSSISIPINNASFSANFVYTKIDDTTYRIKAPMGANINLQFSSDNHETLTESYTVTETRTRRYTVIYKPLRTLVIKSAVTGLAISGAVVTTGNDVYLSDSEGKVFFRSRNSTSGTVEAVDYGIVPFSLPASDVDTSTDVVVYPYVDITLSVLDDKFNAVLEGAIVTFAGTTATIDASGKVVFKASKGTYNYSARYGNNNPVTGQIAVETSAMSLSITVPITKEELRPALNGRAQMHFVTWNNNSISLAVSSSTPCIIYWGDGETTETNPSVSTYTHTFTLPHDYAAKFLVEVGNCTNATYIFSTTKAYSRMVAYWSIGNSKVSGLSFGGASTSYANTSLAYVGSDLFKNDVARTNFEYLFCNCTAFLDYDDGLFDGLIGMTSLSYGLSDTKKLSKDIDLSDCVNLENLAHAFTLCGIKNTPKITSTKLTDLTWAFAGDTMSPIKRDIFPFRSDGSSINASTGYLFAGCTTPFVELPDAIAVYSDDAFRYASIGYLVSYSEIPPTLTSLSFRDTSGIGNIYVPDNAVEAYKSASVWMNYASKIFPMSQKPV
jgi:hypothetical protein